MKKCIFISNSMYETLVYLLIIRFRKLFSKGDYVAMGLLIFGYVLLAVLVFKNYDELKWYCGLFLVDTLVYHRNRRDLELLKLSRTYKRIVFSEYLIYSLPIYVLLMLKQEWYGILIMFLVVFIGISLPKWSFGIWKYPFRMADPYWNISFRKYNLFLVWPLSLALGYIAIKYNNDNLLLGLLLALVLVSCVPSFEKERREEIGRTVLTAEKYLQQQWKTNGINAVYVLLPFGLLLILYSRWSLLPFLILALIIPQVNTVLRYVFYYNNFLHQLFFAFYIGLCLSLYGIPLLVFPFLYKKAIVNIYKIKYATN